MVAKVTQTTNELYVLQASESSRQETLRRWKLLIFAIIITFLKESKLNGQVLKIAAYSKGNGSFCKILTNGSFGDVGEQGVYDANNKFHNIAGTPNLKVRRVFSQSWQCDPNAPKPKIFTNSANLQPFESTSNILGNLCNYEVVNANSGAQYICNPGINITPSNTSDEVTDIDYALMVAEDSVAYSEFQDMGEVMDERVLYAQLVHDTTARNSYPVLNQFYLDRQQSTMAKLVTIDQLLQKLTDTSVVQNPFEFTSVLNEVKQLNATVASAELYDLNERTINGIFIKEMEYGIDSISQAENEWISTLAWECPYVAGNAVFKARMLYMRINPWAHFNDLSICNAVGVYKNGTGLFDEENAEMDNTAQQHGLQVIYAVEKNSIKLYPNPATDQVNVSYNVNPYDKSVLELLDIQGRHIQTIHLPANNNKVSFSIAEWSNAVYTYRFVVNGIIKENGKLIKE
jgi:hypothetical protein